MAVRTVGVVGCGLMGSGIAQVSAQAGLRIIVMEVNQELLDRGIGGIKKNLERLLDKGALSASDRDAIVDRISGTTRVEDLHASDLIVEAITENQPLKNETFAKLDRICSPSAILASNTSSCNVTAMAAATKRPNQVVGLHFFNPVPLMKLVEVVRTILTDDATFRTACSPAPGFWRTRRGGPISLPDGKSRRRTPSRRWAASCGR